MGFRSRTVLFARIALAWFVLTLGAAVAAPLLQAQPTTQVCSANGTAGLRAHPGGEPAPAPSAGHALDCVLCLIAGAPPSVFTGPLPRPLATDVGQAWSRLDAPVLANWHMPWPPRGPPTHS